LTGLGYSVRTFDRINAAYKGLSEETPDAVLLDVVFPEGGLAGVEAVANIRVLCGTRTPVLFISVRNDITARLRAVRAGGDAYLTKPLDITALQEQLEALLRNKSTDLYRVLIIDDDLDAANRLALELQKKGFATHIVNYPMNAIHEVTEFSPDAVLMDLNMRECDGLELARVLRQDDDLVGMPIVFLADEVDAETRQRAAAISDDCFPKPVDTELLTATIARRVRHSRRIAVKIRDISRRDPATGLANRRSFLSDLELAVATASRSDNAHRALLYIAIENLDELRRAVGFARLDELLAHIGTRIKSQVAPDDLVCHFAESVFAVLTTGGGRTASSAAAGQLRDSLSRRPIEIGDALARIKPGIGRVLIDQEVRDVDDLLNQAEAATETALPTAAGESAPSVEPAGEPERSPVDLQEEVRNALDHHAFQLVFQPIVSISDNSDEYYEVMVRLLDRDKRPLLPMQFLPVVRAANRMADIDRWVIENSLSVLSSDSRARTRANFFVKVSADAFSKSSFLPWLSNCLASAGLKGDHRLVFELSETDVAEHHAQAIAFAAGLERPRCACAINHFGSTAQSAQILDEVPAEYVKIHGPIVNRILEDEAARERLEKLVRSAHEAGKEVIVGHVEDPRAIAMLWEWEVGHFQGYYIKKPHESLEFDFGGALVK
ncbi:MAG: EAL domain-containing protein, partial [Pseudomonadota bacterium]